MSTQTIGQFGDPPPRFEIGAKINSCDARCNERQEREIPTALQAP
ncbi:MAG TPA: hypothetical protein VFX07_14155 [Candidatus Udaeobacter sp.]|nr:hypothetical protein [Candidatus Udaeobacter sp.]